MDRFIKIILIALGTVIMAGCGDGNYRNVQVKGVVKNNANNNPIPDAEVLVKCWVYSTENWESNTVDKIVKTDKNGKFEVEFEKGEAIDVIVTANSFKGLEQSKTLNRNRIHFEIFLDK